MYVCLCINTNICMRMLISLYIYFRRTRRPAPMAPRPPTVLLRQLQAPSAAPAAPSPLQCPDFEGSGLHWGGGHRLPQPRPGPEPWGRGQGTGDSWQAGGPAPRHLCGQRGGCVFRGGVCVFVHVCTSICACVWVYLYVCAYECGYVHIHVCAFMNAYAHI